MGINSQTEVNSDSESMNVAKNIPIIANIIKPIINEAQMERFSKLSCCVLSCLCKTNDMTPTKFPIKPIEMNIAKTTSTALITYSVIISLFWCLWSVKQGDA